ncbi:MAG: CDP-diacylglycerol--serine O-phosphatidyltransferase [Syntrophobacteraceae bacterium]
MQNEMKKRRYFKKRKHHPDNGEVNRKIYILPSLFTTGNLFCGFFGIVKAIDGDFFAAALAIIGSWVFDILDGKVARLTRSTSRFGVEYDSLVDLVAFGVAPGVLMYLWALKPFGKLGWLAAFVFVACGALRLARFNVQVDTVSKKYFVGLPIPGAASLVSTTVLFLSQWDGLKASDFGLLLLVVTYLLGFLMVSSIPYNSYKDMGAFKEKPLPILFVLVVLLTVVAAWPQIMLFSLVLTYIVSGPLTFAIRWFRKRNPGEQPAPASPEQLAGQAGGAGGVKDANERLPH